MDQNTYRYQAREATTLYMYCRWWNFPSRTHELRGNVCREFLISPFNVAFLLFPFWPDFRTENVSPLLLISLSLFSGAFPFLSWSGVLSVRDSRRRICADWRWLDLFFFDFSLRLPIPRCYAFPGVVLFCLSASRSDTVVTGKVPFLKKVFFFFALRSCDFFLIFNLHCEDRTIKYVKKNTFWYW